MPKKTFRVKSESGWAEIDPSEAKPQPIHHDVLSDYTLSHIRTVYDVLREVICYNEMPMSLEQFELGFMRECDPDGALKVWEAIASAYLRAIGQFPSDFETRSTIYKWLILLVMGAVTDEEMQREDVQIVRKCFSFPSKAAA